MQLHWSTYNSFRSFGSTEPYHDLCGWGMPATINAFQNKNPCHYAPGLSFLPLADRSDACSVPVRVPAREIYFCQIAHICTEANPLGRALISALQNICQLWWKKCHNHLTSRVETFLFSKNAKYFLLRSTITSYRCAYVWWIWTVTQEGTLKAIKQLICSLKFTWNVIKVIKTKTNYVREFPQWCSRNKSKQYEYRLGAWLSFHRHLCHFV